MAEEDMLPMTARSRLKPIATLAALCALAAAAHANDFPTIERVLFVQECIRNHPGQAFEMTSKCSCALDAIAKEVSFDEYVTMSTASKAISIGGERGGAIRDVPLLEPQIKRYRSLVSKAESGCFLRPEGK
jgi:hypothetical protein